ncbi:cyclin-O [Silurus asotus]|uniref:Cyclin-O n=1 Tax=Silurus asotus TaxID=30991 RepID=A0AAD5AZU5_SILAS|nr:cyclin-O [Silurus asotus]
MTSDSGFEDDIHTPSSSQQRLKGPGSRDPPYTMTQCHDLYSEYEEDHFIHQKNKQEYFLVLNSLSGQTQITAEARCVLVSWLIDLYKYFDLTFESFCLAVNIMDRFLATTAVASDCFQLLGVTSLLIATKYVEVHFPGIKLLLSFCCDAFTREQLCNLESLILIKLNFRLAAPTIAYFLDHFVNCEVIKIEAGMKDKIPEEGKNWMIWKDCEEQLLNVERFKYLAFKVCEISQADYTFNRYKPSVIAQSALNLAMDLLREQLNKSPIQHADSTHTSTDFLGDVEKTSQSLDDPDLIQQCTHELGLLASLNKELLQDIIKL